MSDFLDRIIELREYDVKYHNRVCIDRELRVAQWYELEMEDKIITDVKYLREKLDKPSLKVLAFDIETTKDPLKFPDSTRDMIMMISYMVDGRGFLICNREIISEDIEDFEYSPSAEYEGKFTVFNEENEVKLLEKFFAHCRELNPFIYVTYNGDYFDWTFIND